MFDFDVRSGTDSTLETERLPAPPFRAEPGDALQQPISRLHRRSPLVLAPSVALRDAFMLMADRHVGAAVVASHGVLLGMLSEQDVVRRLLEPEVAAGQLPVWRVMTTSPETLVESDTVAYAVRKMWALGGRAMPILGASGGLVGLLETQDLVAWMCGRVGAGPRPESMSENS